jgi:hypothetical protein
MSPALAAFIANPGILSCRSRTDSLAFAGKCGRSGDLATNGLRPVERIGSACVSTSVFHRSVTTMSLKRRGRSQNTTT